MLLHRKYPKFCVWGRFIFFRLAPILPRRGSARAVPPEPRGYGWRAAADLLRFGVPARNKNASGVYGLTFWFSTLA